MLQTLPSAGVGFVLRRHPDNSLEAFLEEVQASLLIGDENPCREPERWRAVLAKRLKLSFWTVDADVVVPSRIFGKSFFLLHHFRPHLKAALPRWSRCVAPDQAPTCREVDKMPASFPVDRDPTEGFTKLDRRIQPVDTFIGGTRAAVKRLRDFIAHDLASYETQRNHPETVAGTSQFPHIRTSARSSVS